MSVISKEARFFDVCRLAALEGRVFRPNLTLHRVVRGSQLATE
jgi:hypothetical protein